MTITKNNLKLFWQYVRSNGAYQQKVVIFGLAFQVFENALLPVFLHEIPVVDDTMTNGIFDGIARCVVGFVSDIKVKVVETLGQFDTNTFSNSDRFIFFKEENKNEIIRRRKKFHLL